MSATHSVSFYANGTPKTTVACVGRPLDLGDVVSRHKTENANCDAVYTDMIPHHVPRGYNQLVDSPRFCNYLGVRLIQVEPNQWRGAMLLTRTHDGHIFRFMTRKMSLDGLIGSPHLSSFDFYGYRELVAQQYTEFL